MAFRLAVLVCACLFASSCSSSANEPAEIAAVDQASALEVDGTVASTPSTISMIESITASETDTTELVEQDDPASCEAPCGDVLDMSLAEPPSDPLLDPAVSLTPLELSGEDIPMFFATGDHFTGAIVVIDGPSGLVPSDVVVNRTFAGSTITDEAVSKVVNVSAHPAAPQFLSATMQIDYDPALVGAGESPHVWSLDRERGAWIVNPGPQVVDPDQGFIQVELAKLSCHVVLVVEPAVELPVSESSDCRPIVADAPDGFIQVPGIDIPQSVLLQPTELGSEPAVQSSPRFLRFADGTLFEATITYSEVVNFNPDWTIHHEGVCSEVCALLTAAGPEFVIQAVDSQGVWRVE